MTHRQLSLQQITAMSSQEVLLGTVVPVIGGLVAIVMYASPLKACWQARQQQQLGVRLPQADKGAAGSTACVAAWCALCWQLMYLP